MMRRQFLNRKWGIIVKADGPVTSVFTFSRLKKILRLRDRLSVYWNRASDFQHSKLAKGLNYSFIIAQTTLENKNCNKSQMNWIIGCLNKC